MFLVALTDVSTTCTVDRLQKFRTGCRNVINIPSQDYTHPNEHRQFSHDTTPRFKRPLEERFLPVQLRLTLENFTRA